MLSIRYAPHIPQALIDVAEHHARVNGIRLDTLERIGQSLDFVEQFIVAAEDGWVESYATQFETLTPTRQQVSRRDAQVETARLQAATLFGYR